MQVLFDVAPSDDECVPPGQTEHVLVPSVDEYVPAAHSSQAVAPESEYLPGPQSLHWVTESRPGDKPSVPAGQSLHVLMEVAVVTFDHVPR